MGSLYGRVIKPLKFIEQNGDLPRFYRALHYPTNVDFLDTYESSIGGGRSVGLGGVTMRASNKASHVRRIER